MLSTLTHTLMYTADLHRLLHWRQNIEKLPSILTAVTKVPGDEIVKVSKIFML